VSREAASPPVHIGLSSDTSTGPLSAMRAAIAAEVGDEYNGEDPRLQTKSNSRLQACSACRRRYR
jgi:hypothetical protein